MTANEQPTRPGLVYTFYSYKGGVGRSMALANVAALLAQWGHSVLVADWDLEAPGLERFFEKHASGIEARRKTIPGLIDLIEAWRGGSTIPWPDVVLDIHPPLDRPGALGPPRDPQVYPPGTIHLLSAGRNDKAYASRLQNIDFPGMFRDGLGNYIESLRDEWKANYDFVLVDSRTGVTDIGGICTVQLADVLVLLFTTTESSTRGVRDVAERARKEQLRLPVDRERLMVVPVPSRDESRTEYKSAYEWKGRIAEDFAEYYREWLPVGTHPREVIEMLRIPYIPYWSFGENLPVLEEFTTDPSSLSHAYEILARLLRDRLDWRSVLETMPYRSQPRPALA